MKLNQTMKIYFCSVGNFFIFRYPIIFPIPVFSIDIDKRAPLYKIDVLLLL